MLGKGLKGFECLRTSQPGLSLPGDSAHGSQQEWGTEMPTDCHCPRWTSVQKLPASTCPRELSEASQGKFPLSYAPCMLINFRIWANSTVTVTCL